MTEIDAAHLLDRLLPVLCEAARIEIGHFHPCVAVDHKVDLSPVTAADREAEACLIAALAELCPGVPVVAEEEVAAGRVPETGATFFLVDPLDGTREFVAGRLEFTINIGLVAAERPVFGVIYAPMTHELFATVGPGKAAWAELDPQSRQPTIQALAWRPLEGRAPQPGALIAAASRSHRGLGTEEALARLGVAKMLRVGSALKFSLLARGDADVYLRLGETGEWDTAAGQAIVEAAGGSVAMLDGTPLRYGRAHRKFINPPFIAWSRRPSTL